MILLFVSVWMRPSLGLQWPRTVIVVGRPARSRSNFSFERFAELLAHKVVEEFAERRTIGKLGHRKASAFRDLWVAALSSARASGRTKPGTTKYSNGSRVSGTASRLRGRESVDSSSGFLCRRLAPAEF